MSDREQYDVVVVGAGIGGAALSTLLGRAGIRALLLDKDRNFAPITKGESLQPRAVEILDRLGVLGRLEAEGAHRVHGAWLLDLTSDERLVLNYENDLTTGPPYGLGVHHRTIQKAILAQAEQTPGVTTRFGAVVQDVVRTDGRVTGVRYRIGDEEREVSCALVVASDGRNSKIREVLDIKLKVDSQPYRGYGVVLAAQPACLSRYVRIMTDEHGWVLTIPLAQTETRVAFSIPNESDQPFSKSKKKCDKRLRKLLSRLGCDQEIDLNPALQTVVPMQNRVASRLSVDGAVLMADAARTMDVIAGQGMTQALNDAALLAEIIEGGLADGRVGKKAIERFARDRDPASFVAGDLSEKLALLTCRNDPWRRWLFRRWLRHVGANDALYGKIVHNVAGQIPSPVRAFEALQQFGFVPYRRGRLGASRREAVLDGSRAAAPVS